VTTVRASTSVSTGPVSSTGDESSGNGAAYRTVSTGTGGSAASEVTTGASSLLEVLLVRLSRRQEMYLLELVELRLLLDLLL